MTSTSAPTTLRTRRVKTWSAFGNLGRKPNEYEVVTHNIVPSPTRRSSPRSYISSPPDSR